MKEIEELELPENVRYTEDHEWANLEGGEVKVGISDYAQDQLGDIVFVELPPPGEAFQGGEEFGTLESVKAVAEMYMPISGKIHAINEALEDAPELLNSSPYNDGWIIQIEPDNAEDLNNLMDRNAYLNMLEGMK